MPKKNRTIQIDNQSVSVTKHNSHDYISLTDMVKMKGGDFFITDWLRNKNTLAFIGIWEQMHNPEFDSRAFSILTEDSGLNSFRISIKEIVNTTGAIGVFSKAGRYGGTYAHKDIAFEFGTWISPVFKMYLIKEYQRLKENESNHHNLEWNVQRLLSKANYHIQTDAIKTHIIPTSKHKGERQWLAYAEEADLLNMALFGCTAKEWREANPEHAKDGKNIRDFASINQLTVLSNLETLNAEFIYNNQPVEERYEKLIRIAQRQLAIFNDKDVFKSVRKLNNDNPFSF